MMDLSEKGSGSGSESNNSKRTCSDCQTTKTPLWRGGPDGPKSLCNACGIRYRKKRRALLGLNKGGNSEDKKKERKSGVSLKLRLMGVGREMLWKGSKGKLGEEEQAAVLLMALSCGSVYG